MVIEIRKDYLTGRYTIFSPKRADRPHDVKKKKQKAKCPFCPGNEYMTPPAVLEMKKNGRWQIRVTPNKFPIMNAHEVVIESPEHEKDIAMEPVKKIEEILDVYAKRYVALSKQKGIKYVQIFRNRGEKGGASLAHPHTQIIGTPAIPALVSQEMNACKKYRAKYKRCMLCDLAKNESRKERFVAKNSSFVAFTPYASRYPYETWIVPVRHASRISDMDKKQIHDFADMLKKILLKLDKVLNKPAYNFIIHQSPLRGYGHYHMHLEILPVTTIVAGFEKSTDYAVNLTLPEEAAKQLRKV